MIFDINSYGIGIGLVMVGWIAGLVFSLVASIIKGVSHL